MLIELILQDQDNMKLNLNSKIIKVIILQKIKEILVIFQIFQHLILISIKMQLRNLNNKEI